MGLWLLEAVWKQSLYKIRSYVICRARLRTDLLDNRSLAMLLEISKRLIYWTLVSGQPLSVGARTSCRPAVRVHVLRLYQRSFMAVKRTVLHCCASVLPECWLTENAA